MLTAGVRDASKITKTSRKDVASKSRIVATLPFTCAYDFFFGVFTSGHEWYVDAGSITLSDVYRRSST